MAQRSTRRNQINDFCCFRFVIEQRALTVIKLLRFFVLIVAVFFLPDFIFLYHSGTRVIQFSSKLWMFLISTPLPLKPEHSVARGLIAVTTNTNETVLR